MSRVSSSLVSALVALDTASPDPLHRQLYGKLRNAILTGRISPGAQIPSSRDLARELGVARNTVLNAVEQLIAEGYLQGEPGSGTMYIELCQTIRSTFHVYRLLPRKEHESTFRFLSAVEAWRIYQLFSPRRDGRSPFI